MLRVLGAEAGKGGAKRALQRGEVFLADPWTPAVGGHTVRLLDHAEALGWVPPEVAGTKRSPDGRTMAPAPAPPSPSRRRPSTENAPMRMPWSTWNTISTGPMKV